jgi:hypothetical protein
MKFHELQAKREQLRIDVKIKEETLQKEWKATIGSNQPLMMGLNLLSSTFNQDQFKPIVSFIQAAVFVYQDFKEQKLPSKDKFIEYFISIANRLTGKEPN